MALNTNRTPREIILERAVYRVAKNFKEYEDLESVARKEHNQTDVRKRTLEFLEEQQGLVDEDPRHQ